MVVVSVVKTCPDFAPEVPEGTRYVGEKWSSGAVRTSAPADHFAPKGGDAQPKHSLTTRSADSPMRLGAGLAGKCADCVNPDSSARASVRA